MHRPRRIATSVALTAVATCALAACSQGTGSQGAGSGVTGTGATQSSTGGAGAAVTESNPPGDIPDTQAYVAYSPSGSHFSVKIPEGWSRSTTGGTTTFASKLNRVLISVTSASSAPTVAGARATAVPKLKQSVPKFQEGKVSTLTRGGQPVVRIDYQGDSAPDPVTGKVVRDSFETYLYYKAGTVLRLTLAGPTNADNVDPWRIVSDSVRWH